MSNLAKSVFHNAKVSYKHKLAACFSVSGRFYRANGMNGVMKKDEDIHTCVMLSLSKHNRLGQVFDKLRLTMRESLDHNIYNTAFYHNYLFRGFAIQVLLHIGVG
jgi:hypothetical protein